MFLPFLLLFFAIAAVAVVAYGTHPAWGKYPHGIEYIMMVRQWQWPLIALAIILCLALIGIVASGKRKIWWLLGLIPVLGLITHHLYSDPLRIYSIHDAPTFVAADQSKLADDDYVVGLRFNNAYYAYPYYALYFTPVVVQSDHDQRMVLMWSPFANRAVAAHVSLDLHPRDLEIVSMPANGLLVYNHKFGQFISGITGLVMKSAKPAAPTNFNAPIPTQKMTWKAWRTAHPETQVMAPRNPGLDLKSFNKPQLPYFPMPPLDDTFPANARVVLVPGSLSADALPIAILQERVFTFKDPNLATPSMPIVLVKVPETGQLRIFNRQLAGYDEAPRFTLKPDAKRKTMVLVDNIKEKSAWTLDGKPVEGPASRIPDQRTLKIVPADEDLYWGVTKLWIPDVRPIDPGHK